MQGHTHTVPTLNCCTQQYMEGNTHSTDIKLLYTAVHARKHSVPTLNCCTQQYMQGHTHTVPTLNCCTQQYMQGHTHSTDIKLL